MWRVCACRRGGHRAASGVRSLHARAGTKLGWLYFTVPSPAKPPLLPKICVFEMRLKLGMSVCTVTQVFARAGQENQGVTASLAQAASVGPGRREAQQVKAAPGPPPWSPHGRRRKLTSKGFPYKPCSRSPVPKQINECNFLENVRRGRGWGVVEQSRAGAALGEDPGLAPGTTRRPTVL